MKKVLIVSIFIVYNSLALAQEEQKIDKKLNSCLDKSINEYERQSCYSEAYTAWDDELNKYYNLYMSKLSDENKQILKASQRSWIRFRDKEFYLIDKHYLLELKGTMWRAIAISQKTNLVQERAKKLKGYYQELRDFR